jgi:hypothetical protein
VDESERIPVKRYGQVPEMAQDAPTPAPAQARPSRLRIFVGTVCWLLMAAFAVGLVLRFGH